MSTEHRVRLAVIVNGLYIWECVCGYSPPSYVSKNAANDAYRRHKAGASDSGGLTVRDLVHIAPGSEELPH